MSDGVTYNVVGGVPFEAVVYNFKRHVVPQKCRHCEKLCSKLLLEADQSSLDADTDVDELCIDTCFIHNTSSWKQAVPETPRERIPKVERREKGKNGRGGQGFWNSRSLPDQAAFTTSFRTHQHPVKLKYVHGASPYTSLPAVAESSQQQCKLISTSRRNAAASEHVPVDYAFRSFQLLHPRIKSITNAQTTMENHNVIFERFYKRYCRAQPSPMTSQSVRRHHTSPVDFGGFQHYNDVSMHLRDYKLKYVFFSTI